MKCRTAVLALAHGLALGSASPLSTFEPSDPVEVIIIGAGWSGMAMADRLSRANVSFVVLESSNRTGGRSHAVEFGDPSVWRGVVERGAEGSMG